MKIGVSSYSFSKHFVATKCSYIDICDIAKEMGFDGIEFINLASARWGFEGVDELALAAEIREHCEKIGLEIIAYTVGANFLEPDVAKTIADLKHCVDVCEALGAKVMRHDVAANPAQLRPEPLYNYRKAIAEIAPYIREVTENHGYFFQAPERVEELILAVNHPNYGWLCDIGNFLCADVDPIHAVQIAAPYTKHVHLKDFLFKPGTEPCPAGFGITTNGGNYIRGTVVGHGVVPIRACITALKKAGYEGWASIEFEGAEDNIPALKNGLAFVKSIVG